MGNTKPWGERRRKECINVKMKHTIKSPERKNPAEGTLCNDKKCPFHGSLSIRGRNFQGIVAKMHSKTATIEFERTVYYPKYERYAKAKTKLHAHVPDCIASKVKAGSLVEIGGCRPLSKTVHYVILHVVK